MQIFSKETLDYVAHRFKIYFHGHDRRMSYRDAATLIDYVSGPAPACGGSDAIDLTRPHVSGGGGRRPSDSSVEGVVGRLEEMQDIDDEWAAVFDELRQRCERDPEAEQIIKYAFEKRQTEAETCEAMGISRSTYHRDKATVLSIAAVLAIQNRKIIY